MQLSPSSWSAVVVSGLALGAWALAGSPASAQLCDEDAASACFDDAGADDDDAGVVQSLPDASVDAAVSVTACSCTTNEREDVDTDGKGRVHVCTGSLDEAACAKLVCNEGDYEPRACSTRNVRYCCQMPSGYYSQLYDDCDHPRCESGFRAQCEAENGAITHGACDVPRGLETADEDDARGGFCSAAPGRSSEASGALFSLVCAALWARRRRPRVTS